MNPLMPIRSPVPENREPVREILPYDHPPAKSYKTETIVTLLAYILGAWFAGFVINSIFLADIRKQESRGILTEDTGCLNTMFWGAVAIFGVGMVSVVVVAISSASLH